MQDGKQTPYMFCLTLLIATIHFYKALRHPVAAFHCSPLKISTDRMPEEPLLFHRSFLQIQVNKLLKSHLFPLFFFFFLCSSGKLLVGCQSTIKHQYSITPAQYCCQNDICCSTWIAMAAATTIHYPTYAPAFPNARLQMRTKCKPQPGQAPTRHMAQLVFPPPSLTAMIFHCPTLWEYTLIQF